MIDADLVVFVSQYAQKVITAKASGRIANSVVIPHGVGVQFKAAAGQWRPSWLPADDYVLYVSNFEPYKHQVSVVRAFARLREAQDGTTKLLLIGPPSSRRYTKQVLDEIDRLHLGSAVLIRESASQIELAAAYGHARVGVFASTCENCPNVLLEAMAAGRPLVVSNRAPMPEFARQAALYCDPEDPAGMAARITALFDDPGLSADLGRRAAEESQKFDWATTAERTWRAILDAWSASRRTEGASRRGH